MKQIIKTNGAPAAIGPYSQAIKVTKPSAFLFVSGQIPIDPETGNVVEGRIKEQTQRVMLNIKAILDEAGFTFKDIMKADCFLLDMNDFVAMNDVYASYFEGDFPARITCGVGRLPKDVLVEIALYAVKCDED